MDAIETCHEKHNVCVLTRRLSRRRAAHNPEGGARVYIPLCRMSGRLQGDNRDGS
jgi:hypothetical protein